MLNYPHPKRDKNLNASQQQHNQVVKLNHFYSITKKKYSVIQSVLKKMNDFFLTLKTTDSS